MSWDVMINRYDGPPPRVPDLPDDFRFPPMGDADTVRAQVSAVCPAVDWSDPAWGILEAGDYSIEFNLQKAGVVDGFMLHVRGGGDPVGVIARLCAANRWVALDTSTGEFMDLANPSRARWDSFRSFRDQIVGQLMGRQPWYRRLLKVFAPRR
jgi:hypothetical protein